MRIRDCRFLRKLIIVVLIQMPFRLFAEEVNDFRSQPASPRSVQEINRLINDHLKKFADKFSDTVRGRALSPKSADSKCSRDLILETALDWFDENFTEIGNTLRDRDGAYAIEYAGGNAEDKAIYQNTNVRGCCVSTVNVNNVVIGIDKIDHFFGNGGLLFAESLRNPKLTDHDILYMNSQQEHAGWGLRGTKIKSYGDLNANWAGLKFYRNLIDGDHPFLSCKDGKLTVNKYFKIEDYVHVGWNEATNCSAFTTKEDAETFEKNLAKAHYKCPMVSEQCSSLKKMYPDGSYEQATLVSPVCLKGVPLSESVEAASTVSWNDLKKAAGGIRPKDVFDLIRKAVE